MGCNSKSVFWYFTEMKKKAPKLVSCYPMKSGKFRVCPFLNFSFCGMFLQCKEFGIVEDHRESYHHILQGNKSFPLFTVSF